MAKKSADPNAQFAPALNVAYVNQLNRSMVHEHELDRIAEGSPATLAFNVAIALLSAAVGLLLTVTTTTIAKPWLFSTYLFCCINFFLVGGVLMAYWWKTATSVRRVVDEIKRRMPPTLGVQEPMPIDFPARGAPGVADR